MCVDKMGKLDDVMQKNDVEQNDWPQLQSDLVLGDGTYVLIKTESRNVISNINHK